MKHLIYLFYFLFLFNNYYANSISKKKSICTLQNELSGITLNVLEKGRMLLSSFKNKTKINKDCNNIVEVNIPRNVFDIIDSAYEWGINLSKKFIDDSSQFSRKDLNKLIEEGKDYLKKLNNI